VKPTIIVFSRDRAMQLDATLRSFFIHCRDAQHTDLTIIYRASSPSRARQYLQLREQWATINNMCFVEQQQFRNDVLSALTRHDHSALARLSVRCLSIFRRQRRNFLFRWLRQQVPGHVLFLVDDCVFVSEFALLEVVDTLSARPAALGYSLRLGRNTTCCYPLARAQELPAFEQITPQRLSYVWGTADADFAYPLEVSSSVYRRADLLPLLYRLPFQNPNQLEKAMAFSAVNFKLSRPDLLCFDTSVAFCNPLNKVQSEYDNRVEQSGRYSVDALARLFDDGYRIKVDHYSGFVSSACHQEVDLQFERCQG